MDGTVQAPTSDALASDSLSCGNSHVDSEPVKTTQTNDTSSDSESTTDRKYKPRVVKVEQKGIYTVKTFESINILQEWIKALRASNPYIIRLFKIFWKLSPTRVSILVTASLCKAVMPNLFILLHKRFLDQVQSVTNGQTTQWERMILLILLGVGVQVTSHGLDIVSDKVGEVLETRLMRELDSMFIQSYVRLDCNQLDSKRVKSLLEKAEQFTDHYPSQVILLWIDFVGYVLRIISSTYTLSQIFPKTAKPLLFFNIAKACITAHELITDYTSSRRLQISNQHWHRLRRLRDFAFSEELRPDIKVNGLESWIPSQQQQAFQALGDTSTKPFWRNQAKDTIPFVRRISNHLLVWAENCWFLYEGLHNGMSLGTLLLIRSSMNDLLEQVWELAGTADDVADEWKQIVAFFKCKELKPQIRAPEDCIPYVRNPAGMKVEARGIRFKYDEDDEEEILKGVSFIINPGAMVAVLGSNGAGKSTLARLLTRIVDVTDGELLINDINVNQYDPVVLRQHISALFQDVGEYSGLTVAANIGLGKVENMDDVSAIQQAAIDAGAADFIEKFPHKYDSYLGGIPGWWNCYQGLDTWNQYDSESDSDDDDEELKEQKKKVQRDLSGGQWQKLGLARAFMRRNDADLMVLDEPSANLDPEAEVALFETIRKTREGRTTIYISHRFNTIKFADQIMVLEDGVVKEFGTHQALMDISDGKYRKLYSLQAMGFEIKDL